MKTDGVTFVDSVVKEMTKEEFIEAHINVVWLNLKEGAFLLLSLATPH